MAGYSFRSESDSVKLLRVQLDVVNSQNTRLNEENSLLRHKLNRLTNEQRTTSNATVESKLRAFTLEDERDKMYENLERLKAQYNKLHTAYLEKVKRVKSLEEVFSKQKVLPGLVKKSSLERYRKVEPAHSTKQNEETHLSTTKIAVLQRSLDEAFDIIDELEFELESVDYLEMENERLKNELGQLKKDGRRHDKNDDHRHDRSSTCSSACDECGCDGLPDLESIERSVLTESLIDTVQTESHLLRRQLLRSRLQYTKPHRTSGCPKGVLPEEKEEKD